MKYKRSYRDKDSPGWDSKKLPTWYYILAIFTAVLWTAAFLVPIWMPAHGIKYGNPSGLLRFGWFPLYIPIRNIKKYTI